MTVNEIIVALEKMKAEDPERFYNALGYGDQGACIMNQFVSGSYELGLVAGALWMQEQKLSPISCGHENGTEWSEDDQHQKEQVLNALRLELNEWLNHSVRGMKSGNPAYFQGKITLIHDLLGFIHDIDELDRVFCSQIVLEPNEDMATFQVSTMVSYELLEYLNEHEDGFKMLADQIVSELKRQAAKLL